MASEKLMLPNQMIDNEEVSVKNVRRLQRTKELIVLVTMIVGQYAT